MSSAVGFTAEGYRSLSTATYALVGAASATSYVLYTQVGLSQGGVIPLLRGTLAPSVRISSADKVKIWRGFYNAAKKMALGGTAAAVLCDAIVIATHPKACVRKLSLASGIVGSLIVPFTYAFIIPTNKALFALDDEKRLEGEVTPELEKKADTLIGRWEALHAARFAMYAGAMLLAGAALLCDGRYTYVSEVVVQ